MTTILAAIDFSEVSSAVADNAIRFAKALRGRLLFVHVNVIPPPMLSAATELPIPANLVNLKPALQKAKRKLQGFARRAENAGIKVEAEAISGVTASSALLEFCNLRKPDVVVVGSHGHGALYDLLVGSTAAALLKRAGVPVIVVPAGDKVTATQAKPSGRRVSSS